MSRTSRYILYILGGFVSLLVLALVTVPLFLDTDAYRQQLEERISQASGMELRIGELHIGFFPSLKAVLRELHLRREEEDVASAREIELGLEFWPLLRGEAKISRIALHDPVFFIERYEDGRFNVQKREPYAGTLPTLNLQNVSVTNGSLHFVDAISPGDYELTACNINVDDASLSNRDAPLVYGRLSLAAELACKGIRKNAITVNDVGFAVKGTDGVFDIEPAMLLFGSEGKGSLHADFSGTIPRYELDYSLPQLRIEAFLETLAKKQVLEGSVDFSARLSLQGNSRAEMKQSLAGNISLRGQDLMLHGKDLDEEFALFESSQNFSLVDVGALLVAGPLGVVATKGYDFANLFQADGTTSEIHALVSDWTVADGIAQADDVAIVTNQNRLALKGALDFPNGQFIAMTMGLLDASGCARIEQVIHGSFQNPEIEKPGILMSLAGPALSLLEGGMHLLPGEADEKCEPFYTGSLQSRQ